MNPFIPLTTIQEKELVPGFNARLIHTDQVSIAYVEVEKGAVLPEHHHINEQVTSIIRGELEMTVNGETKVCRPGDVVVLGAHVPHSARALTDCSLIDVFHPVREDYK